MKKIKVLFVCLGNICRSPLAEAILKHKLKEKNIDKFFEIDSCGTSNYEIGNNSDARTIANAKKNGVLVEHCARQITIQDLADADYILTMDSTNHQHVLRLPGADKHSHKVSMLREYDPHGKGDIPDPYFGNEHNFQEVFEIANRTIEAFVKHLKSVHSSV